MAQTVLIVDDHAGFRRAARALLEAEGYVVVAESATGGEALEAAGRLHPQVVLLDVGLPDLDGLEVCRRLQGPGRVVVLTSAATPPTTRPLHRVGARGFIPKAELSGDTLAALAA